jgi:hypothetical protein
MKIIKRYANKLIKTLPDNIKIKNIQEPLKLDLVLDGGMFNGSYLIGALYFLKKMEKQKYVIIERISATSVGSICGLLYLLNVLDMNIKLYDNMIKNLNTSYHLTELKKMHLYLKGIIPVDFYKKMKNVFFVTFHNLKTKKRIIKSSYKSNADLIDSVIKSSFVPFVIDGSLCYENKYVDGLNPFMFKKNNDHNKNKEILILDLLGYDKINHIPSVKNEKNNFNRILSGLLDIHNFYVTEKNTMMCSYLSHHGCSQYFYYKIRHLIAYSVFYLLCIIYSFKKQIKNLTESFFCVKLFRKILRTTYYTYVESYVLP